MTNGNHTRIAKFLLAGVVAAVVMYFLPPSTMASLLAQASPFGSGCEATGFVRLAGRTDQSGTTVALEEGDETTTDAAGAFHLEMPDEGNLTAAHAGFIGAEALGVYCTGNEVAMNDLNLPGGDLNQDITVDMLDLVGIAKSYSACAGAANFNPDADLNGSGCVDMMDLVLVGAAYGRSGPVEWSVRPGGGDGDGGDGGGGGSGGGSEGGSPVSISFAADVNPILQGKCRLCHGDSGGLTMKDHASLLAGGRSGPVIVPGDAESSLLYKRITAQVQPGMPPGGVRLDDADIETIRAWVDEGAPNN